MASLYEEMWQRFPEIRERIEGDAELPFVVMMALAGYLAELAIRDLTPDLVNRIVAFTKWCESQERGETASDDILTILTVSFYEHLFEHETTRALLPKIMQKEHIVANAAYLQSWVGKDNYDLALAQYVEQPS